MNATDQQVTRRHHTGLHRTEHDLKQRTNEDGRQQRPWQAGFLLRLVVHLAFYGWVGWWWLGKPEIPIRWLQ